MKEHINPGKPSTVDKAAGATEKVDKHQGPRETAPAPVIVNDQKLPDPMKPDISKS